MESCWIYPNDLAEGKVSSLPQMSIQLQNTLRKSKKLTYTKIGKRVVYKKEWIEEYIERNIRKADLKEA
jgi:hypothetical protein